MSSSSQIRVLDDPDVVRLISDPLRLRLLEMLRQRPQTVKELAAALGVPRTRLYHHIKLLEERDLIAVDATRVVSGITEKRYRVTAYRLSIDKRLFGAGEDGQSSLDAFLTLVLDEVVTEVQRAIAAGLIDVEHVHEDIHAPRRLVIGRRWLRLTDDQLARFEEAFGSMMEEFQSADAVDCDGFPEGDGTLYEFLTGFYPVVPPDDADERE